MWKLSEGATAIAGTVIGALLGGVTTFAADVRQDRAEDREAALLREQEAFVLVLAAAAEYRGALVEVVGVSDAPDEETYERVRRTADASATRLVTAVTRAGLVLEDPEPVFVLSDAYLAEPVAFDLADPQTAADIDEIIEKGSEATAELEQAARAVVQSRLDG